VETTIGLPDSMLRDAEATATAEGKSLESPLRGESLKEFFAEAVSGRLCRTTPSSY
jgi:hypothetical protein